MLLLVETENFLTPFMNVEDHSIESSYFILQT